MTQAALLALLVFLNNLFTDEGQSVPKEPKFCTQAAAAMMTAAHPVVAKDIQ